MNSMGKPDADVRSAARLNDKNVCSKHTRDGLLVAQYRNNGEMRLIDSTTWKQARYSMAKRARKQRKQSTSCPCNLQRVLIGPESGTNTFGLPTLPLPVPAVLSFGSAGSPCH